MRIQAIASRALAVAIVGVMTVGAVGLMSGPASGLPSAGKFVPLTAAKIFDTRDNTGSAGTVALGAGATKNVQLTGRGGVPTANVTAVLVNITSVNPSAATYFAMYPAGSTRPAATVLQGNAGEVTSNLAVIEPGTSGAATIWNAASAAHVVVDVEGYFTTDTTATGDGFVAQDHTQILDTRFTVGGHNYRMAAGETITLPQSVSAIPSEAVAGLFNVTIVSPTGSGWVTLYSPANTRPNVSSLDFMSGENTATTVVSALRASDGAFSIYNPGPAIFDVTIDLQGYFVGDPEAAGSFVPLTRRAFDSRSGSPIPANGGMTTATLTGGGVPTDGTAAAILANIHAVAASAPGTLSVEPVNRDFPITAGDVQYAGNESSSNLVSIELPLNGQVQIKNFGSAAVHVVIDVEGYVVGGGLPNDPNTDPNTLLARPTVTPDTEANDRAPAPIQFLRTGEGSSAEQTLSADPTLQALLHAGGQTRTYTVNSSSPWTTISQQSNGEFQAGVALEFTLSAPASLTNASVWYVDSQSESNIPQPYYQQALVSGDFVNAFHIIALVDTTAGKVAGYQFPDDSFTPTTMLQAWPYPISPNSGDES